MHYEYEDEWSGKSRSQKKRDSTSAQRLGTSLGTLSETTLYALEVPQALIHAIADWKKFPGHEAKRRQMQYIGKLMREMDIESLQERLNTHLAPSQEETRAMHAVEELRDFLITATDAELEEKIAHLAATHPKLAAPKLRHLIVTAREERAKKLPPKAYREIFRYLKDLANTQTTA